MIKPEAEKKAQTGLLAGLLLFLVVLSPWPAAKAQINTDRMMTIGRNALYFDDYILSIQYFNQVIRSKPYLAEPYLYRAVAKLSLEDFLSAEEDCSAALERNPFIVRAYYFRSYARMHLKKYEAAIEDCQQGLEFDTEHKGLMLNKGISRMYAGQHQEARKDLDELLRKDPNFLYAYMSRGQLSVETGDTLGAIDDFSRALAVDPYFAPAYASRAYVNLIRENFTDAISDFNEAIYLEPDNESYFINRALARYQINDYRGSLSDLDRVVQINPNSLTAYFNRGLIRAEVGDDNRAIEDFDKVIFMEPGNDLAIYNRAVLRSATGDFKGAEADLGLIIERYPNFYPAYYQRSELRKKMNDAKGADKDYFAAWDLENKIREQRAAGQEVSAAGDKQEDQKTREETDKDLFKYNRVIVPPNELEQSSRYANPIRGRVQDQHVQIALEPIYRLSFYEELHPVRVKRPMNYNRYLELLKEREVRLEDLLISNRSKSLSAEQVDMHFESIDRYSKIIGEEPGRAVLFFARALDFALVKDNDNALADLNRALFLDQDFVLAYFERANLRFDLLMFEQSQNTEEEIQLKEFSSLNRNEEKQAKTRLTTVGEEAFGADYILVMQDYEKVLEIAPEFVYAWYNRGYIRFLQKDYRSALEDFNRAIELSTDFAEAWYNRGIIRIYLGERESGLKDLSKAGELGMYKAYNLIKRFAE